MKEENDLPSFLVVVKPGKNRYGKSPFGEKMVSQYIEAVINEFPEDLAGYVMVERGLLGSSIAKLVDMGYQPHLVGGGEDRKDDYSKQIQYIKNTELAEKLPKEFKLVETPRIMSSTDARNHLKNDDFSALKKLLPKSVLNFYSSLVSDMK
jgi:predicted nucleotidyltransferase